MAKTKGRIEINTERCKGCELCVDLCPQNVIRLSEKVNSKGYHYAYMEDPEKCTACTNCAIVCPDGVISVFRIKNNENQ